MSVIEHGAVEAPEVLTEREQRARTLEAAALEIEVRGWERGSDSAHWERGGPVCLAGSILAAKDLRPSLNGFPRYLDAERVFGSQCGRNCLWFFNDHRAGSAEEVTFLLRWRAEEIRDGWDA